ncbi:(-)-germacrene D synthase [Bienertia sinuspersici]
MVTTKVFQNQIKQEANQLKELVRQELVTVVEDPKKRLEYIDAILRLGVAYHFEKEIEDNLRKFCNNLQSDDCYVDDLHYVSLRFHVFEKFKCKNGIFKDCLTSDVQGLLSLYEASHLRLHGEKTLEEALLFSTTHLTSFATQSSSSMAEQIAHSLQLPLHKRSIRLESRYQISFCETNPCHDKNLLRFAKIDFNLLQELHRMELSDFTRWSRDFDLIAKLPDNMVRNRAVETYFWSLGTFHEPYYANARMYSNRLFKIISIIDDIYDSYGTIEELILFTDAIQRWDKSCINELPCYLRSFYQAILETFEELDQDFLREKRSYAVDYVREQMRATCQGYFQEAKWSHHKQIPAYEDFLKNGVLTSGYLYTFVASFLGMGEIASKGSFEWIRMNSKAAIASCIFCRLINDISSHKHEKERNHVATAVECYMKQFGTSEEETYKKIQFRMEEEWININQEMLQPTTAVPMAIFNRVINLSRILFEYYQIDQDGYTISKYLEPKVAQVLVDYVPI